VTLYPSTHEHSLMIALVPPAKRRSPIAALLLSVLFPGLGHLYIGLRRHAAWLIGAELLAIAGVAFGNGEIHGQSLVVLLTLYCFAIIDSYFSAREWNAGATALMTGANPRIASVLNFLTKGFGYFYLGDRAKGIAVFLAVGSVQVIRILHPSVWIQILCVTVQVLIAADGYRIARQRLVADHPEIGAVDLANLTGLQTAGASRLFFVLSATMMLGYASLVVVNGRYRTTMGALESGPSGLVYRNAAERLQMSAPVDWEYSHPPNALIDLSGDGCSIVAYEKFYMSAASTDVDSNRRGILTRYPDANIESSPAVLNGRKFESFEASFKNRSGVTVHQRYMVGRRRLHIFIFIETWVDPDQRSLLDGVDRSLRF
jgi:TM2 domain-containing membrane protein YozV